MRTQAFKLIRLNYRGIVFPVDDCLKCYFHGCITIDHGSQAQPRRLILYLVIDRLGGIIQRTG